MSTFLRDWPAVNFDNSSACARCFPATFALFRNSSSCPAFELSGATRGDALLIRQEANHTAAVEVTVDVLSYSENKRPRRR